MISPYNTAIVYVRERPIKLFGKGVNNNRKDGYHSRIQLKPSMTKGEQYTLKVIEIKPRFVIYYELSVISFFLAQRGDAYDC